ncbi:hypothetical protein J1N35_040305 [Gossypium stocksii]|uniref:Uncharacterized protein n=1 Tax=Gossypium stocksii TaxID=47602 RepID=A0A9D3ZI82_9ROSI|nr:hypothetical protein J1N35_040305 [Gossypium stocksii]
MLAWDKVYFPNGIGDLGFRKLMLFNLALLGRQVWRLFSHKNMLRYHVLSSKYFPNGDIFHSKCIEKPSFTWSSISTAAKSLEDGSGWQVGNWRSIRIKRDKWGFEGLNGDDYPKSHAILAYGGLNGRLLDGDYTCCIDWLEDAMQLLEKKSFEDFLTTL